MIIEINYLAKTITIEQATAIELKKLIKRYSDYNFVSKAINEYTVSSWDVASPYGSFTSNIINQSNT